MPNYVGSVIGADWASALERFGPSEVVIERRRWSSWTVIGQMRAPRWIKPDRITHVLPAPWLSYPTDWVPPAEYCWAQACLDDVVTDARCEAVGHSVVVDDHWYIRSAASDDRSGWCAWVDDLFVQLPGDTLLTQISYRPWPPGPANL